MILAGDVGGTKTVLGLFDEEAGRLYECTTAEFPSRSHRGLESILAQFLDSAPVFAARRRIRSAGFGVAGPVIQRRVQATNLPWVIEAGSLERQLGFSVHLMNDLAAMALGVGELEPDDFAIVQPGRADLPANAAAAIIAAGTGLGEGILFRVGEQWVPAPTEGGHTDLGARNEEEIAFLRFLIARHGRADYEHVLSGPGIMNCYRFTHGEGAPEVPSSHHDDLLAASDPPAAITGSALAGSCPACARSLNLFVTIYGAEAGNLALKTMALRGVYIGGGIAPKILPALTDGRFLAAFRDKGERFSTLLAGVPVRVILDPHCPLLGAARAAAGSL
jgi:glucokinase